MVESKINLWGFTLPIGVCKGFSVDAGKWKAAFHEFEIENTHIID